LIIEEMRVMSRTRSVRLRVRSVEARMSSRARSSLSLVSAAWVATRSTVSAICPEVRASSSMLAEVSVALELCRAVVAASWLDATANRIAESERSVLVPCTLPIRASRRATMRLKASPRVATSTAPEGETRAVRSPAETRRATRERARMGRTSSCAIPREKSAASTRPTPRTTNPELRRSVTPVSAWLAGSLTRIAHWTSEASAYPVMVSVPLIVMREEPERPVPERAAAIAALSTSVRRAPRASICVEVSEAALPMEVVYRR
jgi:hypothetical protein